MGVTHADSGLPKVLNGVATTEEQRFDLLGSTRAVSLRNTGGESLWVSFDRKEWFDVPSGTSWGSHAVARYFWCCTQLGETSFVVNRVDVGLGEDHLDVEPPLLHVDEPGPMLTMPQPVGSP